LHKGISEYDTSGIIEISHHTFKTPYSTGSTVQGYSRSRTLLLHKQVVIYGIVWLWYSRV